MKSTLLALVAAVAFPVAAQNAAPRVDRPETPQAKDARLTDKERARLAKSQNKQGRKLAAHECGKDKKKTPAG